MAMTKCRRPRWQRLVAVTNIGGATLCCALPGEPRCIIKACCQWVRESNFHVASCFLSHSVLLASVRLPQSRIPGPLLKKMCADSRGVSRGLTAEYSWHYDVCPLASLLQSLRWVTVCSQTQARVIPLLNAITASLICTLKATSGPR